MISSTELFLGDIRGLRCTGLKKVNFFVGHPVYTKWKTPQEFTRNEKMYKVPPLVAYKRPQNIKDKLIRSKVPPILSGRSTQEFTRKEKMYKV